MLEYDRVLGWRAAPNLDLRYDVLDAAGDRSTVRLRTNEHGFRRWGDVAAERPKILVVGDSFTFARHVTQSETYYALMAEALDAELFVYGGEGYGTVQEYLLIDAYIDQIGPDIVLLQFCSNDFYGNDLELERNTARHNNVKRRPFFRSNGTVYYGFPKRPEWLWSFAYARSRFLYSILFRIDRASAPFRALPEAEQKVRKLGEDYDLFRRSVETTGVIFDSLKQRCGEVPVYGFLAGKGVTSQQSFYRLAPGRGIVVLEGVAEAVLHAERGGRVVRSEDGAHWNREGHRICAELLIPRLREALALVAEGKGRPRR